MLQCEISVTCVILFGKRESDRERERERERERDEAIETWPDMEGTGAESVREVVVVKFCACKSNSIVERDR